jgi:5'-3' exonuclease
VIITVDATGLAYRMW